MNIRKLASTDRDAVREMLLVCGAFTAEEVKVALDMVDSGLAGDYALPVVEMEGRVRAYACVGKAALTASTWYLYWICVHPSVQGRGVGRRLQCCVEEVVRDSGGDRLVLETSGRPDYERTRRFYRQAGFREVGRIPDFYKPGDDCVVYCKVLGAAE
jgi:ribosomal protein S18 acetylase RimI-like enzyme